jgi:hypothetical protein
MQFTCAATPLAKAAAASHQTPDTHEELMRQVFITTNTPHYYCKPPIVASMTFSTFVNIMEI